MTSYIQVVDHFKPLGQDAFVVIEVGACLSYKKWYTNNTYRLIQMESKQVTSSLAVNRAATSVNAWEMVKETCSM